MEYALLIYGDEKTWASWDEQQHREHSARHERFAAMLKQRNAMRGAQELALAGTATTLRHSGGGSGVRRTNNDDDVGITDGPFAETSEVLGGFYLIDAADLDEAIELAKQMPEQVVEIRPVVPGPESS